MDTKNPRREVAGVSDVNLAADPEIHTTTAPATLAGFDFTRMDDHSGKLDVIVSLIDTAIDELPPCEKSNHRSTNLLFAAFWMLKQQYDDFGQMHTDLARIKRAEACHA